MTVTGRELAMHHVATGRMLLDQADRERDGATVATMPKISLKYQAAMAHFAAAQAIMATREAAGDHWRHGNAEGSD